MPNVTVIVDDNIIVDQYVREIQDRFTRKDIFKLPFDGAATSYSIAKGKIIVMSLSIKYPSIYLVGLLGLLAGVFFFKSWLVMIPSSLLTMTGILYTSLFYHLGMHWGLRRAGYTGKIKHITASKAWGVYLGAD